MNLIGHFFPEDPVVQRYFLSKVEWIKVLMLFQR
jgi:hypothetical protein